MKKVANVLFEGVEYSALFRFAGLLTDEQLARLNVFCQGCNWPVNDCQVGYWEVAQLHVRDCYALYHCTRCKQYTLLNFEQSQLWNENQQAMPVKSA